MLDERACGQIQGEYVEALTNLSGASFLPEATLAFLLLVFFLFFFLNENLQTCSPLSSRRELERQHSRMCIAAAHDIK